MFGGRWRGPSGESQSRASGRRRRRESGFGTSERWRGIQCLTTVSRTRRRGSERRWRREGRRRGPDDHSTSHSFQQPVHRSAITSPQSLLPRHLGCPSTASASFGAVFRHPACWRRLRLDWIGPSDRFGAWDRIWVGLGLKFGQPSPDERRVSIKPCTAYQSTLILLTPLQHRAPHRQQAQSHHPGASSHHALQSSKSDLHTMSTNITTHLQHPGQRTDSGNHQSP